MRKRQTYREVVPMSVMANSVLSDIKSARRPSFEEKKPLLAKELAHRTRLMAQARKGNRAAIKRLMEEYGLWITVGENRALS